MTLGVFLGWFLSGVPLAYILGLVLFKMFTNNLFFYKNEAKLANLTNDRLIRSTQPEKSLMNH